MNPSASLPSSPIPIRFYIRFLSSPSTSIHLNLATTHLNPPSTRFNLPQILPSLHSSTRTADALRHHNFCRLYAPAALLIRVKLLRGCPTWHWLRPALDGFGTSFLINLSPNPPLPVPSPLPTHLTWPPTYLPTVYSSSFPVPLPACRPACLFAWLHAPISTWKNCCFLLCIYLCYTWLKMVFMKTLCVGMIFFDSFDCLVTF